MEMLRRGEAGAIPFRTGRFFIVDSHWYFAAREGLDQGPFETKHLAEIGLQEFLKQVTLVEDRMKA